MPNLLWKSDFVSILSDISFDRWGPNCKSFQFWNCKPWSYLPAASTWCDDVCDGHIMLAVVQKYVNGPAKQVPQVQFGMPITETDKHPTHWDLHPRQENLTTSGPHSTAKGPLIYLNTVPSTNRIKLPRRYACAHVRPVRGILCPFITCKEN